MQTGEPVGQKVIPSGHHREARAGAEVDAERCRIVDEEQDDGERNNEASDAEGARAQAQRLRDGADNVYGFGGDEGQD